MDKSIRSSFRKIALAVGTICLAIMAWMVLERALDVIIGAWLNYMER